MRCKSAHVTALEERQETQVLLEGFPYFCNRCFYRHDTHWHYIFHIDSSGLRAYDPMLSLRLFSRTMGHQGHSQEIRADFAEQVGHLLALHDHGYVCHINHCINSD